MKCCSSSLALLVATECSQTIAPFHGKHGRIIRGHVSPLLEGVTITLSSEQIGGIAIATDKDGVYRYILVLLLLYYDVITVCCHSYGPILSDVTVTVVCCVHVMTQCTVLASLLIVECL